MMLMVKVLLITDAKTLAKLHITPFMRQEKSAELSRDRRYQHQ